MAVTRVNIWLLDVANSAGARGDIRYHDMVSDLKPVLESLADVTSLSALCTSSSNGLNVAASAYAAPDEEPVALYVSVGTISRYVLLEEAATNLRADSALDLSAGSSAVLRSNEVLLTRSGTPGIAWTAQADPRDEDEQQPPLVPSGFLMRLAIDTAIVDPVYLTAVLNHPVWRALTRALSAGKRQDNINQASLRHVPIPVPEPSVQAAVAATYQEAIRQVDAVMTHQPLLSDLCDDVLRSALGLTPPAAGASPTGKVMVNLSAVAAARGARFDHRIHSSAHRAVRRTLASAGSVPLIDLLSQPPMKGRQPRTVDDTAEDTGLAIAVSTIQAGQAILANAKPVALFSTETFPVTAGQVVMAVDGDGSIGKAAVVPDSSLPLTCDSHVAILQPKAGVSAQALACYLNSSFGATQTYALMSGSTGQTQLSLGDLSAMQVPASLAGCSAQIENGYAAVLTEFERTADAVDRIMAEAAKTTSQQIGLAADVDLAKLLLMARRG